jgi:8-oxo-dGTP pyrophosphatase MutT (NUDIX family)
MTPPARRSAAALVARLKKQFRRHRNADGVFPILDSLQTRVAWSRFPNTAQDARPAAVLIPIVAFPNPRTNVDEFHVIFTQRSSHMRTHAAEISFPGGGLEEDVDDTLIDTALRETQEELLHDPEQFKWTVIGQGSAVPSIRGIPVTPVLAVGSSDDDGKLLLPSSSSSSINALFPGSPDEVQRVFSISVEELLHVETTRPLPGRLGTPAPVFPVRIEDDDETVDIWGLTAFVLQPILHKVLKPALIEDDSEDEDAADSRPSSKL